MSLLTTDQIQDLVLSIVETCGPCLNDDELTEHIALLLENIAGFETASSRSVDRIINDVRRRYHDTVNQHEADRSHEA
jgi:hypothetical protein